MEKIIIYLDKDEKSLQISEKLRNLVTKLGKRVKVDEYVEKPFNRRVFLVRIASYFGGVDELLIETIYSSGKAELCKVVNNLPDIPTIRMGDNMYVADEAVKLADKMLNKIIKVATGVDNVSLNSILLSVVKDLRPIKIEIEDTTVIQFMRNLLLDYIAYFEKLRNEGSISGDDYSRLVKAYERLLLPR